MGGSPDGDPTVTPATAIAQCISHGTPTYILRQALPVTKEVSLIRNSSLDFLQHLTFIFGCSRRIMYDTVSVWSRSG